MGFEAAWTEPQGITREDSDCLIYSNSAAALRVNPLEKSLSIQESGNARRKGALGGGRSVLGATKRGVEADWLRPATARLHQA